MNFTGAIAESLIMSHDLSKNHGTFFMKALDADPDTGNAFVLPFHRICIVSLSDFITEHLKKVTGNGLIKINIKKIKFPRDSSIYGSVYRNSNTSEITIYINGDLNECWCRFAICKELIQLYVDGDVGKIHQFYTPKNIKEQMRDLVRSQRTLTNASEEIQFDEGFNLEATAFITTVDLIFPIADKNNLFVLGGMIDSNKYQYTNYDLALSYKMPEFIVKFYRRYIEKQSLLLLKTS